MKLAIKNKKKIIKIASVVLAAVGLFFGLIYGVYLVEIVGLFNSGQRYPMGESQESLPKFIKHNPIDVEELDEVTKFRSGAGHSYADTYEDCSSMKHYIVTTNKQDDVKKVPIYSPVDGKVTFSLPDPPSLGGSAEGKDGAQIWIKPDGYPEFTVILFHVTKLDDVSLFTRVEAGQQIGWQMTNGDDIAVMQAGSFGWRFRSAFKVMDDRAFAEYAEYGLTDRDQMIISKAERDANPLSCDGQAFVHSERRSEDIVLINAEPETDGEEQGQNYQTYRTRQECETASDRPCQYVKCDHDPEDSSMGPACPENTPEGWVQSMPGQPGQPPR